MTEPGVCLIKSEYLIKHQEIQETNNINNVTNNVTGGTTNTDDPPPSKKIRLSNEEKRKLRGQNKSRPVYKVCKLDNLCRSQHDGPDLKECTYEKCKCVHDIKKYLETKPNDISDTCYIYTTKGFCSRGLTCRFAKSHITENLTNLRADFFNENAPNEYFNKVPLELQKKLRKKLYDFNKSNIILSTVGKSTNISNTFNDTEKNNTDELMIEKRIGNTSDMDIVKERPEEKKQIDFRNKLFLSPLTTVGNLPFRRICKEFGADITCGEMACSLPIINGLPQEWALTRRHISEDIFGVQLCGNNAQLVTYASQVIKEHCNIDFIDLNLGCPIELIYAQGGGCALLRRSPVLESLIKCCTQILQDIAFTVKTRTGIYSNKNVAHEYIPKFEEWGAKAVTLHGRSREQRYTKNADWNYIQECATKAKNIPIIGNGDILSYIDYNLAKEIAPNVSSIMIGRGALIKPWLFQEIKEQKHLDPSSGERFDIMKKFINYGLEHWGSDTKGVENTRRFFLEWHSFMYRYVPYGLLERPPQKINQRPERYHGRNDLETLMASDKSSDWIKLSEMFLGPVPDDFTFLPKHKANAY